MRLRRYAYLFLGMSLGLANTAPVYAAGNYVFAESKGEDVVDTETVEVSNEEEFAEALKNYKSISLKNDIELHKQIFVEDSIMSKPIYKMTVNGNGHSIYTGDDYQDSDKTYVIDFRTDKLKQLVFKNVTIKSQGRVVSITHGDILIESDVYFEGTGISGMGLVELNGGKIDLKGMGSYLTGLYGGDVIINGGEVKGSSTYFGVQAGKSMILKSGTITDNLIGVYFGGEYLKIEEGGISVEGNSDSDFQFGDLEPDVRLDIQNSAYEYLKDRPKFKIQGIVRDTNGDIVERVDMTSPSSQFESIDGKEPFYERFCQANVFEKYKNREFLQAQIQFPWSKNPKVLIDGKALAVDADGKQYGYRADYKVVILGGKAPYIVTIESDEVVEAKPKATSSDATKEESEESKKIEEEKQEEARKEEERKQEEARKEEERKQEEARKEEERKQEEARKEEEAKQEEQRKQEEARKAEEAKQEEQRRQEEARKTEEIRKEEQRRQEEARKAEEVKQEEARKTEEIRKEEQRKQEEVRKAEEAKQEEARKSEQNSKIGQENKVQEAKKEEQSGNNLGASNNNSNAGSLSASSAGTSRNNSSSGSVSAGSSGGSGGGGSRGGSSGGSGGGSRGGSGGGGSRGSSGGGGSRGGAGALGGVSKKSGESGASANAFTKEITTDKPKATAGTWVQSGGKWKLDLGGGNLAASQWALLNNTWYAFGKDNEMLTGFAKVDNVRYFFNQDGSMAKGWVKQGTDNWYYFNVDTGAMSTGWLNLNGKWYYIEQSGIMAKDKWVEGSDNKKYYLKEDGSMAINETVKDGHRTGADGSQVG